MNENSPTHPLDLTPASPPDDLRLPRRPGRRGVAAYIRLTKDESVKKGLSAAAQRENLTEYARRAGLRDVQFYTEPEAIGGHVPFEKRTAGARLVHDMKAGQIAHLIVRDIDRLTRDVLLRLEMEKLCDAHDVTIHTLTGVLSTRSPSDRFANRVRAAAAALEKDQTGDRVRRVKRELASRGRHVGGPPPFGYTSQSRVQADLIRAGANQEDAARQAQEQLPQAHFLYVDPIEATVVKRIFDYYVLKRWGSRRITNELNRLGFRRRSGLPWHPDKIRRIIGNPVVAGFVPHDEAYFQAGRGRRTPKPDQKLYKGLHEAIIEESVWRRAQEIRKANASRISRRGEPTFTSPRFILSGVLRCACGAPMRVGSAQGDREHAYYVCRKRFYFGKGGVGGCGFPRIHTGRVHVAFWSKLGELIASPDLTDRLYDLSQRLAAERRRQPAASPELASELERVEADLRVWYERHDAAASELEKEAAWHRVLQLTERKRHLAASIRNQPSEPAPAVCPVTREQIAHHLGHLADAMARAEDGGRAFIRPLVDNHDLTVQMRDGQSVSIQLALAPPGSDGPPSGEYTVRLQADARMAADKITAWVEEQQGKHRCKECGKVIEICRRHFWRGTPEYHHKCWLRILHRHRKAPAAGYYTGQQAADRLGIGRTTLNRWIRRGLVPKPITSVKPFILFDRRAIDRLARRLGRSAAG